MDKHGELKYRERFSEREYKIMLERDHKDVTFAAIGKEFGISSNRVHQIYSRAKRKQLVLYLQAIDAVEGKEIEKYGAITYDLADKFGDHKSAVAYLEHEYADILDDLRNGEPPSGHTYQEINPNFHRQATYLELYNISELSAEDREAYEEDCNSIFRGRFFYRIRLNETEQLVFREKIAGKSLEKIAEQLGITRGLAQATYQGALHVQLNMKLSIIKKATGKSFDEIESEIPNYDDYPLRFAQKLKYIEQAYESVLSSYEMSAVKE